MRKVLFYSTVHGGERVRIKNSPRYNLKVAIQRPGFFQLGPPSLKFYNSFRDIITSLWCEHMTL